MALAERFDGEIINADAIQMYKGLPIATNKISAEKKKGIPHHLLGCVDLHVAPWTVGKFVAEAGKIISEIRSRGKVPVLVGGTHYYTQSLLLRKVVAEDTAEFLSTEEQEKRWPILAGSGEEMLDELRKIDPIMAGKWHPKDGRKIRRSLEICLRTGKSASEIYAEQRVVKIESDQDTKSMEQRSAAPLNSFSGNGLIAHTTPPDLLYDTILFWMYEAPEVLKERLSDRVDDMVSNGLLSEVEYMEATYQYLEQSGPPVDSTKGIWVAIGYKEFEHYLEAVRAGADEKTLQKSKQQGVELTKIATRQYAKRQDRWIRLKLLQALRDVNAADKLFLLDRSDPSLEIESVSFQITESFLLGDHLPDPVSLSQTAREILSPSQPGVDKANDYVRQCELCDVNTTTAKSWQEHLQSRKHKRMLRPSRDNMHRRQAGMVAEHDSIHRMA